MRFQLLALLAVASVACGEDTSSQPPPAPSPTPSPDGGSAPSCAPPSSGVLSCLGPRPGGCSRPGIVGCALDCDPGRANCDGNESNGCEVDRLSDPNNCGACGASATTCVNGMAAPPPEPLFDCGWIAEGIAVDGAKLYFMCDGVLRSAAKGSWATTTLAEGEWTYGAAGLQIVDGFLYWAWRSDRRTGQVRRMPVGGGAIETVIANVNPGSNVLVHAGVAYVVDTVLEKPAHGHVVDSTGRTVAECEPTASLAAIGDVLYVSDSTGVRSMKFDGTDAKLATTKRGIVVSNEATLAIVSQDFTTYQLGTGTSPTTTLGFHPAGAMFGVGDDVVWTRGTSHYEGGMFEGGESMIAAIDRTSHRVQIRALVNRNATFINPGRTIGPMAQDESFVYFGTSGMVGAPATIARLPK